MVAVEKAGVQTAVMPLATDKMAVVLATGTVSAAVAVAGTAATLIPTKYLVA